MSPDSPILIAGGGIGGLTAALALARRNIPVAVFEQAPEIAEIGAGFQISSNGTRVLSHLGLTDEMAAIAWVPEGKEIRMWDTGETWPLFDLGAESIRRYGFPYYMFHRADLQAVLLEALRSAAPDAIRTNAQVVGFEQNGEGVTIKLADGGTVQGAALIGADGVHSTIRHALFGTDDPVFTGSLAWRGVIQAADLPIGKFKPVGTNWVGPGGHVIHYFLRRGELLNFVGIKERDDWQVESWSAQGSVEECLADFDGWNPDILMLIQHIETPYKWALMVREPLARWSVGRVTLLGDACHSMVPMLAQGAVAAIEDGMVLARCIDAYDETAAALAAYEKARHERTSKIVLGSAENAKRFHSDTLADAGNAAEFIEREWHPEKVAARYDWLFTYDATSAEI